MEKTEKNFTKIFKSLARYRFENNLIGIIKIM